jgi:hypothetical protein
MERSHQWAKIFGEHVPTSPRVSPKAVMSDAGKPQPLLKLVLFPPSGFFICQSGETRVAFSLFCDFVEPCCSIAEFIWSF